MVTRVVTLVVKVVTKVTRVVTVVVRVVTMVTRVVTLVVRVVTMVTRVVTMVVRVVTMVTRVVTLVVKVVSMVTRVMTIVTKGSSHGSWCCSHCGRMVTKAARVVIRLRLGDGIPRIVGIRKGRVSGMGAYCGFKY